METVLIILSVLLLTSWSISVYAPINCSLSIETTVSVNMNSIGTRTTDDDTIYQPIFVGKKFTSTHAIMADFHYEYIRDDLKKNYRLNSVCLKVMKLSGLFNYKIVEIDLSKENEVHLILEMSFFQANPK